MEGNIEELDNGIQKLVDIMNKYPGWQTVASCEGHPFEPERGDHAFITFELVGNSLEDYKFFHTLLGHGINVSFGHEKRVIISHPWRQYNQNPSRKDKVNMNNSFIKKAQEVFTDYISKKK